MSLLSVVGRRVRTSAEVGERIEGWCLPRFGGHASLNSRTNFDP